MPPPTGDDREVTTVDEGFQIPNKTARPQNNEPEPVKNNK